MTDLSDLFDEFLLSVKSFKPLTPLNNEDRFILFKRGVRRMFIDTGRAEIYSPSLLPDEGELKAFPFKLGVDEMEYILLSARIAFYKQMASDMAGPNRITSHKTDALTVTFSDKSYSDIAASIDGLENQLKELYLKMPQFHRGYGA